MTELLGCQYVTSAGEPDKYHGAWVDDEGLLYDQADGSTQYTHCKWMPHQVLAGKILITGLSPMGETIPATLSLEEVRKLIRDTTGAPKIPEYFVMQVTEEGGQTDLVDAEELQSSIHRLREDWTPKVIQYTDDVQIWINPEYTTKLYVGLPVFSIPDLPYTILGPFSIVPLDKDGNLTKGRINVPEFMSKVSCLIMQPHPNHVSKEPESCSIH